MPVTTGEESGTRIGLSRRRIRRRCRPARPATGRMTARRSRRPSTSTVRSPGVSDMRSAASSRTTDGSRLLADPRRTPTIRRRSFTGRALPRQPFAASLFSDFPFTGQINLLTPAPSIGRRSCFGTSCREASRFVSIGAPAGRHGDWSIQGAMTQGDVSSWIAGGLVRRTGPPTWRIATNSACPTARSATTAATRGAGSRQRRQPQRRRRVRF